MPVCNLRYPAVYLPTKEVVLIEGSVVQLGDVSVVRKQEDCLATTKPMETKTYKFIVWKDEWQSQWNDFTQAPVKKIIGVMPRLMLCKGDRCGVGCKRFHPPVECEIDQVVVDLWNRGWFDTRGKRCSPEDADQFQVLMRIPTVCADGIQAKSGHEGSMWSLADQMAKDLMKSSR